MKEHILKLHQKMVLEVGVHFCWQPLVALERCDAISNSAVHTERYFTVITNKIKKLHSIVKESSFLIHPIISFVGKQGPAMSETEEKRRFESF